MVLKNAVFEAVRNSPLVKKLFYKSLMTPIFTKNPIYSNLYYLNVRQKADALERKPPFCVQIENSSCCNMSCIFCAHESMARKQSCMDASLYRHIIDQCAELEVFQVHLGGYGEPLMDKEYVSKVRYVKSKGIKRVFSVTNGVLLKEEISRNIIEAGLDYLGISIDAATNQTYGRIHRIIGSGRPLYLYDQVHENVETLVRLKKEMGSQTPLIQVRFKDFEANRGEMPVFIKKYSKLVDQINIYQNVTKWPGSDINNNLPRRISLLYFPCYNLWSSMNVCSNGKVSLCVQDYDCRIEVGDLKEQSLMDIWSGTRMQEVRKLHLKKRFDEVLVCRDCDINSHLVNPWWLTSD